MEWEGEDEGEGRGVCKREAERGKGLVLWGLRGG